MRTFDLVLYFNIASFLFFGFNCLFIKQMKIEFTRYGLSNFQRQLTGILQIIGAIGSLIGIWISFLGVLASAGLSLLMLLGFITRIRIKDGILKSSPSFIYMVISAILCYEFYLII